MATVADDGGATYRIACSGGGGTVVRWWVNDLPVPPGTLLWYRLDVGDYRVTPDDLARLRAAHEARGRRARRRREKRRGPRGRRG